MSAGTVVCPLAVMVDSAMTQLLTLCVIVMDTLGFGVLPALSATSPRMHTSSRLEY
jgi:hypothetical protein